LERPEVDAFIAWKRHNQGRSARTEVVYRMALERLATFLDGRDLLEATADELTMFCGPWLHKQGVSARARRPYVAAVREFYRWASRHGRLPENSARTIDYPRTGRKLPTVMSIENAQRIMWAPDFGTFTGVRDAALLGVLIGCGLRASGVVSLNRRHLIHVEHKGEKRMALRVREKGDKERILPVPRETEMLLRVYLEHADLQAIDRALPDGDEVLFVSVGNRRVAAHLYIGERRRLTRGGLHRIVKTHGKAAGVPANELHPHAIRHLYGTELAEDAVDLLLRQELMGHADPKDTRLYDHMAMRRKLEAADKSSPMSKIKTPVSHLLQQLRKRSPST